MDSSDRTYNASLRLLLSLQNDRRKHGDEYGTVDGPAAPAAEPATVDATPEGPEVQAQAPAPEGAISLVGEALPAAENRVQTDDEKIQNKSRGARKTVGGTRGCNEVSGGYVRRSDLVPEVSPDDRLAALMEKYLKEIDKMQLHDPIE